MTVGSFLNVVICRLGTKKKIINARSHCPHCRHILAWYDLIPLLSFVLLKGKCRYCHKKISWQYPLVELATGFLFVVAVIPAITFVIPAQAGIHTLTVLPNIDSRLRGNDIIGSGNDIIGSGNDIIGSGNDIIGNGYDILGIVFLWTIISFLIIIFVYDLKHYLIPDKVIFPAIGLTFVYLLVRFFILFVGTRRGAFLQIINPLLSGLAVSLFFLLLVLITRAKGMGIGDVKLAFLMGLLLSWPNILLALFVAFLSGGLIGTALILAKKKTMKSKVPFGPFLVAGTLIALFWGEWLIWEYGHILI